jgi:membrane-associated protein
MHWSYPGTELWLDAGVVFSATVLEFLGLPAPGGPMLVLAAAGPGLGIRGIIFITLVAALGAAVGDAPWYFLGRFGGARVLHSYCKLTLGSRSCVANTERFFRRFGIQTLIFSKFLPGVRLFAPPFAGSAGYPFTSFLYLDMLGGFLWAGALVLFGRILGPQIPWAFTMRWAWYLTIVPVVVFYFARLAKRLIKGPAEEFYPFNSNEQLPVTIAASAKDTMI